MRNLKFRGKSSTALIALLAGSMFTSPSTIAAENEKEDVKGFTLEEVIVTARKMKENILNTPIAVTAITGASLETRDMTDISAIADISPNVNFSFGGTSSGSSSAAVVYIRGVGQNDFTPVTDPGVGIYIDGVYLARTIGSVLDVVDLESIEVLRGPQGTLFGRNTIGGAINLATRDPGDEYAGRVRVTGGEDNRQEIFASIDLPISDTFRIALTGLSKERDGYVDRVLVPGSNKLGDEDVFGGRAKFVWDATENLTIKFSIDGTRTREESAPEVATGIGGTFIFLYNNNIFGNGAPAACAGGGSVNNPACANEQYVGAPFKSFETGPSRSDVDQWGVSLDAEWQALDNISIKSITAYREVDAQFARASDATPFLIFQTTSDFKQYQFSQELQMSGTSLEGQLKWVTGVFYMKEKASDFDFVEGIIPNFPRNIGGHNDNDNFAAFAEGTYDVTSKLHVTGGVRYTDETKRYDPVSTIVATNTFIIPTGEENLDFNEVTWRGILAYDILDEVSTYFSVSKGFKSGGFVQRLTNPITRIGDDQLPTFDPEKVTSYEIGLKAELPEYGLRFALAAFYSDYTNIQVAANPPGQFNTVTANAAEASIKGIEGEFTWIPVPALFIQGAAGYMDASYDSIDENSGVGVSLDDDLIRTPEFSSNLGVSYLIDLGGGLGTLTPRVDWVYKSSIQFEPVNDDRVASDAYHNVNVNVAYDDPDERWRLTFGVNNVFDETYIIAGDSNDTIGYALAVFARPRNWYLTADFAF